MMSTITKALASLRSIHKINSKRRFDHDPLVLQGLRSLAKGGIIAVIRGGLFLSLLTIASFVSYGSPVLAQEDGKVALQIYFQDTFAFPDSSQELFEEIFHHLRPDLTFKRITIDTSRLKESEIKKELQQRLASALDPGEELSVLILDTHGNTEKPKSDNSATVLRHLGRVYEAGIDAEFENTFAPLKDKASEDLQVILNSCSVFCGGQDKSATRAWALLGYFGAVHGSIYGSNIDEISQALDRKTFFKWKYLFPNPRMLATVAALTTALIFPVMTYEEFMNLQNGEALLSSFFEASQKAVTIGGTMSALMISWKPLFQFLSSRYLLNRGYYFVFRDGELQKSFKVIKHKDLENMILKDLSRLKCQTLLKTPS